jgi:radical SAM superfamily enzyme YgiQ (UPF0313 family)
MDVIIWSGFPKPEGYTSVLYRYIGPYKIADWVRKHGYSAQVIDFADHFDENDLWELTTKFITKDTSVLAISTTFLSQQKYKTDRGIQRLSEPILHVMARIKKEYPYIKVVLGGAYSEMIGGWRLLDAAVIGKGEDIFLELLEHYKKGTPPPKSVRKIPAWGKTVVEQFYEANNKKYNIEVDAFRFAKNDCILWGETLPLELSRGCIFKCKFCQYEDIGKKKLDYLRSIECVREELIYNFENYGVTNYHILCDTFNDTTYKVDQWYKMSQSLPFKLNYSCYLRADLIHRYKDTGHQLYEAGLFGAFHGIESLHPKASHLVGKAWSGKHGREFIPELFHDIWNGQVTQHLSFIVGLPYETKEDILGTVEWFKENKLHAIRFPNLVVHKNVWRSSSEFERNAEDYGFKFYDDKNWNNGWWDSKEAEEYSAFLDQKMYEITKVNNWEAINLLSYGYSKDYILTKNKKEYTDLGYRVDLKLNEYKNLLKNL